MKTENHRGRQQHMEVTKNKRNRRENLIKSKSKGSKWTKRKKGVSPKTLWRYHKLLLVLLVYNWLSSHLHFLSFLLFHVSDGLPEEGCEYAIWPIPDASPYPGGRQTSDMTFNLCISLPLTDRLQDDGPVGEPMDQEEVNLSSLRRWSSPDVTFSFCGALHCVDFSRIGSRLFCWWRGSELNTRLFSCSPGCFYLENRCRGSDPGFYYEAQHGTWWLVDLFGSYLVVQSAFLGKTTWKDTCIRCRETKISLVPLAPDNLQWLKNDQVQYLRHWGTNNVSASCGLQTCALESNVLILCMECKEWIELSHWQTEEQFFVGGQDDLLLCICSVFNRHGSEPGQKHLTEPGNGRRLDKPLWLESARTRSILIGKTELEEGKSPLPPTYLWWGGG